MKSADFTQFWASVGKAADDKYIALASKFESAEGATFAFCHHMNDSLLLRILDATKRADKLRRLNVYFCYELTDQGIAELVKKCPNIQELNLGRCFKLTNSAVAKISSLKELRELDLVRSRAVCLIVLVIPLGPYIVFPAMVVTPQHDFL